MQRYIISLTLTRLKVGEYAFLQLTIYAITQVTNTDRHDINQVNR